MSEEKIYREFGMYKEDVDEFILSLFHNYEHDDKINLIHKILYVDDLQYSILDHEEIDWICRMLGNLCQLLNPETNSENAKLWEIVSKKRIELMKKAGYTS